MSGKQPTAMLNNQFDIVSEHMGTDRPVDFRKTIVVPCQKDPLPLWKDAPLVILDVKCAQIVQHIVPVEIWYRDSAPSVLSGLTYLRREYEPRGLLTGSWKKPTWDATMQEGDPSRECYTSLKIGNFLFIAVVVQTVRGILHINSITGRVYYIAKDGSVAPKPVVDVDYTEMPVRMLLHDCDDIEYQVTWQNPNRATDSKTCKYICRPPDVETELNIVHCISEYGQHTNTARLMRSGTSHETSMMT